MRTPAGETPQDVIGELAAHVFEAPDVSLAATPASDDLKNALQILDGARANVASELVMSEEITDRMLGIEKDLEAVARLLRQALQKLEAK